MTKGQAIMLLRIKLCSLVYTTHSCLGSDYPSCEKNYTHTPSTSGPYSRLADKM